MRLHTETVGSGPDIVLLHGWGMNSAVWGNLADLLGADYRVTRIELPGHGGSPFHESCCGLERWAEACLEAAPERATWIGWSLGGQMALQGALSHPGRIARLVLVGATPRFIQGEDWPHAVTRGSFSGFAAAMRKNPRLTLERFLTLQVRGAVDTQSTLRRLREGLRSRPEPLPEALDRGLEILRGTDLRGRMHELPCPSLWLLGERDTLAPAGVAEALRTLVPDGRVEVVPGAGHAPFLSHTRESMALLRSFLDLS